MAIYLSGTVEVHVKRGDEPEEIETIQSNDFGLEEGNEPTKDNDDGTWRCDALFIAFRDGYSLRLSVAFVGTRLQAFNLEVADEDEDVFARVGNDATLECAVSYSHDEEYN